MRASMKQGILTLLTVLVLAACQSRETTTTTTGETTTTAASTSSESVPYDLQFIDTMTRHHQMAIQMSEMAKDKASDPKVKEFARKIIEDQSMEIKQLEAWREQWFKNAAAAHAMQLAGAASMNMDMSHMQTMSGHQFDMMFFDMMIPHHRGAIEMSREALQKSQRPELKAFAQETIAKQEKEIAELGAWKKSMGTMKQ